MQSIFKKEMDKSPLRLQIMLLTLQRYGFDLEYRPGSKQVIADMLSRAAVDEDTPTADQSQNKVEVFYNSVDDSEPTLYTDLKDKRIESLKRHNVADETMKQLTQAITHGWPGKRNGCTQEIKDYWRTNCPNACNACSNAPIKTKTASIDFFLLHC